MRTLRRIICKLLGHDLFPYAPRDTGPAVHRCWRCGANITIRRTRP